MKEYLRPRAPLRIQLISAPDIGPNFSAPREEVNCADSSNCNTIASFVSTDNDETTPGGNDALELPNKHSPSIVNNVNSDSVVHASSPISKSNESLETTATVVATKLTSRKGDKGPP